MLPGNGDGTFGTQVTYPTGSNPYDVVAVDLNGDGKLDLATANYGSGNDVSVLLNQGVKGAALQASSFASAVSYASGGNYAYKIVAADFNGDGKPDLAVACYNYADVGVLLGNGDGTFQAGQAYSVGGDPYGLTAGDFNGDGIIDLATANYSSSTVAILLGNAAKLLPVDATTGLASGYGRGNLSTSSDVDYFSWTGKAGDVVQVASQDPNGDYDYFEIVNANGSGLVSFGGPNSQSTPYTLPYSGTYFVEVYSGTTGEYRFRVTESPPTLPLVTTYDGSISGSNAPTLVNSSPGNLTATLAGYIGQGDPNGEYFKLGNVVAGTQINLSLTQPTSSLLGGVLNVYNSARDQPHQQPDCRQLVQLHRAGRGRGYVLRAGEFGEHDDGVVLDGLERQHQPPSSLSASADTASGSTTARFGFS